MEKRNLTNLGKYSLAVTLPKEWIRVNKLDSDDSVFIDIQEDGQLVIHPSFHTKDQNKERTLSFEADDDIKTIQRSIIGCYLNGYDTIKIKSGSNFNGEQQKAIRSIVRSLYLRILLSTAREVNLKTFMDESLASVKNGIERMHIITKSMVKDILTCMKEWDIELAKSVIALEEDVDQFMYFLIRLLRSSVMNPSLANKLGLKLIDCFDYYLLVNRMEHVADHLTMIAQNIIDLRERQMDIPEKVFELLITSAEDIFNNYTLAIESFYIADLKNTNKIIDYNEKVKPLEKILDPLPYFGDREKVTLCKICSIRDNITHIAEFASDIAEIAINRHFLPEQS